MKTVVQGKSFCIAFDVTQYYKAISNSSVDVLVKIMARIEMDSEVFN